MTGAQRDPRPAEGDSLADALLRAEAAGTMVEAAHEARDLTMDEGYEVAGEIARRRMRGGWRFRGWKVGFTNREIWPRWGLDRPMVAPVYRETVFDVGRGPGRGGEVAGAPLEVPAGRRAALRIEVEVVFGFLGAGRPPGVGAGSAGVDAPPAGVDALPARGDAAPDWVALSAELVDCHYPGWELHPARSVADFGLHAGLVVGPRVAPLSPGLLRALDGVAARLSAGGEVLAEGVGHAVLGGPANVLVELRGPLAERMAGYGVAGPAAPRDRDAADPTDAAAVTAGATDGGQGYLVSTGTLTPLVEARIGTTYQVEADLLPSFSFVLV